MDPITLAIVAGLAAGVTSGTTKVGEQVIVDAYGALKAILKKKFGDDSDLVSAVDRLEKKPDSAGRKATLEEEVAADKADQDTEVLAAAKALLDEIKAQSDGTSTGAQIAHAGIAGVADARGADFSQAKGVNVVGVSLGNKLAPDDDA